MSGVVLTDVSFCAIHEKSNRKTVTKIALSVDETEAAVHPLTEIKTLKMNIFFEHCENVFAISTMI